MTTESQKAFEKWRDEYCETADYIEERSVEVRKAWQASEQRIKDKLLSEEMVLHLAKLMSGYTFVFETTPAKKAKSALQAIVEGL